MGMDVFGRNPVSELGGYFQASMWDWESLYDAMVRLCRDLVDEKTLSLMESNDGAGPTDGDVCREIATRFENWLEEPGFLDRRTVSTLGFSAIETPGGAPVQELVAEDSEALDECEFRELVQRWVGFLRHCGGFVVW